MPVPVRKYRDLDLDFSAHPVTGALSVLSDGDAVRRSIKNLILTAYYERFERPWIGSPVEHSLFSNANFLTEYQIKTGALNTITQFEPRAEAIQVDIEFDNDLHGYNLNITFKVINIPDPIELTLFLKRTR